MKNPYGHFGSTFLVPVSNDPLPVPAPASTSSTVRFTTYQADPQCHVSTVDKVHLFGKHRVPFSSRYSPIQMPVDVLIGPYF